MPIASLIAVLPLLVACQSTPDENTGPPDDQPIIDTTPGAVVYELDTSASVTDLIFTGVGTTGPQSGTWDSWNVQVTRELDADSEEMEGLEGLQIQLVVDATTVSTSIDALTNHLKTDDFFDVDNFPEAGFASTSITHIEGDSYQVTGEMTLRGTTAAHSFEATIEELDYAIHTTAEMTFSRFDYGLHDGGGTDADSVGPGANEVTLTYDVTLAMLMTL